jgi:hypothetical protein
MLHLVSHWAILVIDHLLLGTFQILRLFCIINRLLNPLLKVQNLIINKVLVYFHLLLKISHLSFVDELKNSRARILNGLYTLFLEVKNLQTNLCFESSVRPIVNGLSLKMQHFCFGFCEFQTFKITTHKRCNEIKSMVLMELTETVNANSLLVIEAEKI